MEMNILLSSCAFQVRHAGKHAWIARPEHPMKMKPSSVRWSSVSGSFTFHTTTRGPLSIPLQFPAILRAVNTALQLQFSDTKDSATGTTKSDNVRTSGWFSS